MTLEKVSFVMSFITLLVGIATFGFTSSIPKFARVGLSLPALLLSAFFFYVGMQAPSLPLATTGSPGSVQQLPQQSAASLDDLAAQFVAALERMGFQRGQPASAAAPAVLPQPIFQQSADDAAIEATTELKESAPVARDPYDIEMAGATQPDYGPETTQKGASDAVSGASGQGSTASAKRESVARVGNIVTCLLAFSRYQMYVRLYRLDGNMQWQRIPGHWTTERADGYLKIDGLAVDVPRFGGRGEPYWVEVVRSGNVVLSTGNYQSGEPEFRVFPFQDNNTPWACPKP